MADVTRTYQTVYTGDSTQAVAQIDLLIAKYGQLDRIVDAVTAKVARFGAMPGVLQGVSSLGNFGRAFAAVGSIADATQTTVASVGTNNGLGAAAASATQLVNQLQAIVASAQAAQQAIAAIPPVGAGGGGPGVGGGGAGLPGGSGVVGFASRTLMRSGIYAGLNLLRSSGRAVGKSGETERDVNAANAEKALMFRQSLRETAVLSGKSEVGDALVKEQLEFQQKTGMLPEEAVVFRNQFRGAVESGKLRGNINNATAERLEQEMATFAVRNQIDPKSAGKLGGLLGEYVPIPDVETGMAKIGEMQAHLNILGVGTAKELVPPFLGLMGEMSGEGGRISDPGRLAAYYAGATIRAGKRPEVAANDIRQANRFFVNGVGRYPDLLAQMGVKPGMSFEESLEAASPMLTRPDAMEWLVSHGAGNVENNQAAVNMASLLPLVKAQMKSPKVASAKNEAMAGNAPFLQSIPGRDRTAEAAQFKSEILQGIKREEITMLRQQAETELRNEQGAIDTTATGITDWLVSAANLGGVSGRQERIDQRVIENQRKAILARNPNAALPGLDTAQSEAGATRLLSSLWGSLGGENGRAFSEVDKRRENAIQVYSQIQNEQAAKDMQQAAQIMLEAANAMANQQGAGALLGGLLIQTGKAGAVPARFP